MNKIMNLNNIKCIIPLYSAALFNLLIITTTTWGEEDKYNFFTNEEKNKIDKFRPLVNDYLTKDYMKTDLYLLRWIKAGEFNLDAAVELMKKTNRWRKENDVDNILDQSFKNHRKYLPYDIDGFDRNGHPLLQIYFGEWEIRKYVLAGKRNLVLQYWNQMAEQLEYKVYETAKKTGKDISQFYYLCDMEGYTLRTHACLQCIPLILDLVASFDPNYPYFMKNITLINTPRIFSPVLTLLKQFLRGPSINVLHEYGYNKSTWQPILLNEISPEQLTPNFGGTKKLLN